MKTAKIPGRGPIVFILTGAVHSGKTSRLMRVVDELRDARVGLEGYLSRAIIEKDEVAGYDLCDLEGGQIIPFVRKRGEKNWEKAGAFYFLPSGLAMAKAIINGYSDDALLIVDEVGPLELRGQGVWADVKAVMARPSASALLVIRRSLLEDFMKLLPRDKVKIFDIGAKDFHQQLIKEIREIVLAK